MSHVGSILQITSIRINVFKVCLHINANKKIIDNLVKIMVHDTATRIYDESWVNSNMPLFRGRLLGYVDTSRTSIL